MSSTAAERQAIKLKLNRKVTPSSPDIKLTPVLLKTENSSVDSGESEDNKPKGQSLTDLISSSVDDSSPAKPQSDSADLGWDDDNFFDSGSQLPKKNNYGSATVEASHKMECIECGAIYESESPLESCTCPECHGTMYPLDLFNGEDTLSYNGFQVEADLDDNEDDTSTVSMSQPESDVVNRMTESKRSIKVAQPISVGMFSSTGTGPLNSASSISLKTVDFLSNTGSSSAIQIEPRLLTPTEEELASLEREKRNIQEERCRLQQEQDEFAAAVAEFENKSKVLEEMRLEIELEKQQQTTVNATQTANMMLIQEQLLRKQEQKSQRVIIIMGVVMALEALAMILLMFIK